MTRPCFSPQTHIFLWDLHDVILEKSVWSWIMICLRFKRKKELLRHLDTKTISIALTFVLEKLKLTKKQMVSEELINAAKNTHNNALIELTMQACSSYRPIKKTVALMKELSDLGYTHHLGSNIGKTVFDDCREKFSAIFNFFTGATIPFRSPDNSYIIKKPHPEFFNTHLKTYNLQPQQLIFIDDKLTNVQAAQAVGAHAIQFKNALQLRTELIKKNILKQ